MQTQSISKEVTPEQKPRPTLSIVVGEISNLIQIIIENGGELTPEIEEALEQKNIVLANKVDAYCYTLEHLELNEKYWKAKAAEFSRTSKALEKVKLKLKDRIKYAMVSINQEEMFGTDFRFKLSKTSGSLVIHNDELIPSEFKTEITVIEINKKNLKNAIAAGEKISGAEIIPNNSLNQYINKKGDKK